MSAKTKFLKKLKDSNLFKAGAAGAALTVNPQESEAGVSKELLQAAMKGLSKAERAELFTKAHIGQTAPTGLTRDQYREVMTEQLLKENSDIAKLVEKGDMQEAQNLLVSKLNLDPSDFELKTPKNFLKSSIHDKAFLAKLKEKMPKASEEDLLDTLIFEKIRMSKNNAGMYHPLSKKAVVFDVPDRNKMDQIGTTVHETSHLIDDLSPEQTLLTELIDPKLFTEFVDPRLDDFAKHGRLSELKKAYNAVSIPEKPKGSFNEQLSLFPHILNKLNPEKAAELTKNIKKSFLESKKLDFNAFLNEYFNKTPSYFPDMGPEELRSIGHSIMFPEGIERTLVKNNIVDQTPILSQLARPAATAGKIAAGAAGATLALGSGSKAEASTEAPEKPEQPGYFWKALEAMGAPQRKALSTVADAIGAKGNPYDSEESSQAIVENLASRVGIPEDSTIGNAAKAAGVAGLEMFADPLEMLSIGAMGKAAMAGKRAWKALGKAPVAPVLDAVKEVAPYVPKRTSLGSVQDQIESAKKYRQLTQDPEKRSKIDELINSLELRTNE